MLTFALCTFALLSGPICGGIGWHAWNRQARERGRNGTSG
jgi:hypothetical protein